MSNKDKLKPLSSLPEAEQKLIQAILHFWFGDSRENAIPHVERFALWFSPEPVTIEWIRSHYEEHIIAAGQGRYDHWLETIEGQLAIIILLDQWARLIYQYQPEAFQYDTKALAICLEGAQHEYEHDLALIERAFYYFPLIHAENEYMVENAIRAYDILVHYALQETKDVYKKFLAIAEHHAKIIHTYGRFPTRNAVLGRENTDNEKLYLLALEEDAALDVF